MTRILRLVPMPPSEAEALAARLAVLRDRQARRRAHLAAWQAMLQRREAEIATLEQRLAVGA
jgi:chromosome segregation ATPase